jgi:hypothetical protein
VPNWKVADVRPRSFCFFFNKPRQRYLPHGIIGLGGRGCGEEIRSVFLKHCSSCFEILLI